MMAQIVKNGDEGMSKTNCINCGSAKDIDEIKCPFCGTTYLDFTAIDFDSGDPVVCQFLLPSWVHGKKNERMLMSMLAVPQICEITSEPISYSFETGATRLSYVQGWDMRVGVTFKPVVRPKDGALFTMKAVRDDG